VADAKKLMASRKDLLLVTSAPRRSSARARSPAQEHPVHRHHGGAPLPKDKPCCCLLDAALQAELGRLQPRRGIRPGAGRHCPWKP
jgi:hypothetical protein